MRAGQGWCWRGLRARHMCTPPCQISVLGFSVLPEDSFALVWMSRTTLASLAPRWLGSFPAEMRIWGCDCCCHPGQAVLVSRPCCGTRAACPPGCDHGCRRRDRQHVCRSRHLSEPRWHPYCAPMWGWDGGEPLPAPQRLGRYLISTQLMSKGESGARAAAHKR